MRQTVSTIHNLVVELYFDGENLCPRQRDSKRLVVLDSTAWKIMGIVIFIDCTHGLYIKLSILFDLKMFLS